MSGVGVAQPGGLLEQEQFVAPGEGVEVAGDDDGLRRRAHEFVQVRELLLAGKTDAEVREHLSQRYGDFILFRPQFSSRNAWLWLTPLLLLLIGLGAAVRVIRRRAALAPTDHSLHDEPRGDSAPPDGSAS